jgi:hypothetical protein
MVDIGVRPPGWQGRMLKLFKEVIRRDRVDRAPEGIAC